ncbi:uncharacterized protein LOC141600103 isoform X1 [Silene latifolia]|uniref:uncharacterized protein LOC141600103 isoform X1 n=1 Tax=Silene latifolia TaxID=37657 RepID=UPI003D775EBF
MARTWMIGGKKGDLEYDAGLAEFYDFVRTNVKDKSSMACPCDMCRNIRYMSFEDVRIHLEKTNFNPKYNRWIFHGESKIIDHMEENVDVQFGEIQRETCLSDDEDPYESNSSLEGSGCENFESSDGRDDMSDKSWGDVFRDDEEEGNMYEIFDDILNETDEDPDETALEDTSVVLEKLKDSEMPLYSSCKHTKLAAIVKLYNLKATNGWSDKSFTGLLELLKDVLPEDNVLPNRTYEAKKILRGIGMKYEKIHACPNDCILYRKEYANLTNCPVCKE